MGRISVVDVPRPDALRADGESLFVPSRASGPTRTGESRLHQATLEASTASPTQFVGGQRTLQFLSQVVQAQDRMLELANDLKA